MVNLVRRIFLLVQRRDRVRHEIHRNDIDAVRRPKGKRRQPRQKHERAHHVELIRLRRGGCRPARCSGGKSCAARPGSSSRTMCSQNFLVRAYGS